MEAATSAVAAVTVPARMPSITRSPSICHGAITNTVRPMVTNAPNWERRSIGLRPLRSAMEPQRGEARAMVPAPMESIMPVQSAWPWVELTPISPKNIGRKGVRMLKPMIARSWAIQIA